MSSGRAYGSKKSPEEKVLFVEKYFYFTLPLYKMGVILIKPAAGYTELLRHARYPPDTFIRAIFIALPYLLLNQLSPFLVLHIRWALLLN